MTDGINSGRRLVGWKEISAHLRVSVRTAQSLEKERGLPVRRGNGLKGPVFAVLSEMDAWRVSQERISDDITMQVQSPNTSSTRRAWLHYGLGSATAIAAGAFSYGLPKLRFGGEPLPVAFRVDGATLVILGQNEDELWRYRFGHELRATSYTDDQVYGQERCLFVDLDGDGRTEVLFQQIPRATDVERPITCFDCKGKVRWEFVPTRTVFDRLGRSFAPPFWPNNFQVYAENPGSAARVVAVSNHHWSFPTQVAVLDGKSGKLLSEYWHRGHLLHMASADLDGDAKPEILLGGVNDAPEYRRATVVIFDHRSLSGASKSPKGDVYFQGMSPGSEKQVIFFPRTPVSNDLEFNRVSRLTTSRSRITATVVESTDEGDRCFVVYEFDYRLRAINVGLSNGLMERYRDMQEQHKLPKESVSSITERLKAEVIVL